MKFIALFVSALFLFMKQALGEDFSNFFIIGGSPAPRGRYEYAANLYFSSAASRPSCGGTLIAKNIVLTAAHCAGAVQVGVGCYDVGANENCDRINVVREILHPSYTGSVSGGFDISILVLAQDSRFDPIPLVADENYANQFSSGFPLTVMGWGTTIQGVNAASDVLLEVDVDYVLQSSCDSSYSGRITSSMMCAASPGKDACQGDSGGPLIAKCDATGNDVLVGVVSWGFGCASPSYPGVYARVSTAWPWIESQLSALGSLGDITSPVPSLSNFCSAGPVPTPRPTPNPTPSPVDSSGCADLVPSGLVYSNGQPAECVDLGGFACFYYPIVRERCPKTCGTCATTSRIGGEVETVQLEDLVTPEEARKANVGVAAGAVAGCAVFAIAFVTTYRRMTKKTVSSSVI